jgi:hypothetical protein
MKIGLEKYIHGPKRFVIDSLSIYGFYTHQKGGYRVIFWGLDPDPVTSSGSGSD